MRNPIVKSPENVKPKELDRLNMFCFSSILFTENLNSSLERTLFTCRQWIGKIKFYTFWTKFGIGPNELLEVVEDLK